MQGIFELSKVGRGKRRDVLIDGTITVGRSSQNALVLRHAKVSRTHCVIEPSDDGVLVRDLDSTGGTWVNKKRIREHRLTQGDRVRIGPYELKFVLPDSPTNGVHGSTNGTTDDAPLPLIETMQATAPAEPEASSGETDVDDTHAEFRLLEEEVARLKDQLSHITRDHAREASQWRTILQEKDECIVQLEESLREARRREDLAAQGIERAEGDAADAQTKADELAQQLADLEQTHASESQSHAADQQRIEELERLVTSLTADRDALSAEVQTTAERLERLQTERNEAVAALQSAKEDVHQHDDAEQALAGEVQAAREDARRLREQVGELEANRAETLQRLDERTEERQTLIQRVDELEALLDSSESQHEEALAAKNCELDTLRAQMAKLEEELEVVRAEMLQLARKGQTHNANKSRLQKRIEQLDNELKAANRCAAEAREQKEQAAVELAQREAAEQRALEQLQRLQASHERDSAEREATIAQLRQSLQEAAQSLADHQSDHEALLKRMQQYERDNARIEEQVVSLRHESQVASEALQATIDRLTGERDALHTDLKTAASRVRELEDQRTQFKADREPVKPRREASSPTQRASAAVLPTAARLAGESASEPARSNSKRARQLPTYPEDIDYLKWIAIAFTVLVIVVFGVVGMLKIIGG